MFGTYNLINMIVIINVLIAMMNNSYQFISDHADIGLAYLLSHIIWAYHMDIAYWVNVICTVMKYPRYDEFVKDIPINPCLAALVLT